MTIELNRRRLWTAWAILAFAASSRRARAGAASVHIDNFSFTPATITVKPDTVTTWTNQDDIPHSIVAADGTFHSRALDTDESYSVTFTTPGTYNYYCGLHPHMTGRVVVSP